MFPIELSPVSLASASEIFEAIDAHREDLRVWLPFVDGLKTVADEERFLQSVFACPEEERDRMFIIRREGCFCGLIGYLGTVWKDHRTEIGYWLLPEYRHAGLMTRSVCALCRYAVEALGMNAVRIRCAAGNMASNAVPQRLGFTREGTEREGELLLGGVYADIHVYSILRREVLSPDFLRKAKEANVYISE